MGDRIGIQFINENCDDSVVIHSHWMGRSLLVLVQEFIKDIPETEDIDPSTAVAKFLMWVGKEYGLDHDIDVQDSDCYDDCEDNGVFTMNLKTKIIE